MYKTLRWLSRSAIRSQPEALFVFGDNLRRTGFGGQAKECRGEANVVGIPTKHEPSMRESAFFTDADFDLASKPISAAFDRLEGHLAQGGDVYWPEGGVGTGLAELDKRAPAIAAYIESRRSALAQNYGVSSGRLDFFAKTLGVDL